MISRLLNTRARAIALCATVAVLATAAACSDRSGSKLSKSTGDSIAAALPTLGDTSATSTSGHKYGPPTGKIRIANLLDIDGHPSGPLDFYDVRKPDSAAVPLIKGLKYGEISDYVSPRAEGPYPGAHSWLYLFAAGIKQATKPFGGNIDNGWDATDQLTIALGPSRGFSDAASISQTTIVEGGKKIDAAHADSETAIQGSKALLIVRAANGSADSMPEQYLMIDGACPHAANDHNGNGDTAAFMKEPSTVSNTLLYPIAAGSHTLAIVTSPRGKGLLTCAGHTPGAATTLSVQSGRRYAVWVYGVPSAGLKVAAAAIAAP